MNKIPSMSVVMSVFSEPEEWLRESIDSILNQTYSDFEFIIINDNPLRDLNREILVKYQDSDDRVIVIHNKENIGLTKSLNKGLEIARGKFIARMDGDDISLPERFQLQFDFMQDNPEYVICGSYIRNFGLRKGIKKFPVISDDCIEQLMLNSCFAHPTVIIRKEILQKNNIRYDEIFKQTQDYKLWVDLIGKGKFYNIPEVLLNYRNTKQQVSNIKSENQKNLARLCRRQCVERLINNKSVLNIIKNDKILSSEIKYLSDSVNHSNLKILLWLSLDYYGVKTFIIFILSGVWTSCSLLQFMAILKRFLKGPNKLI